MTGIKQTLDRLETHLQALIEKRVASLLTPHTSLNTLDLSHRVVAAIHQCMLEDPQDNHTAPEIITIQTHPLQAAEIRQDDSLISELQTAIQNAVLQAGLFFEHPPELTVEENELLGPHEFEVEAAYQPVDVNQTQMIDSGGRNDASPLAIENAFLIYPGNHVLSLDDHMFTLGSGPENDLQITEPTVAKQHAQLRLIGDHYVIFDLDTASGTYVNQRQVRQQTLRTGDVILIGNTRIIYGKNYNQPVGQTQEYIPSPTDPDNIKD